MGKFIDLQPSQRTLPGFEWDSDYADKRISTVNI